MDAFYAGMLAFERHDVDTAREQLALAGGNPEASLILGQFASSGTGEPEDPYKAAILYQRAASLGSAVAAYNMGTLHAAGRGVPQDWSEALSWYKRAGTLGHLTALHTAGTMYANGQGTAVDMDEAERAFLGAATKGHPQAMIDLGTLNQYYKRDVVAAARWYLKAPTHGSETVIERRMLQLLPDLRALADGGDAAAQLLYGVYFALWQNDTATALPYLYRASNAGNAEAQRTLAAFLQDENPSEAHDLYKRAAKAGDALAAFNLAVMSSKDTDGKSECIEWARVAAINGVKQAYMLLGNMLAASGTPEGGCEARHWFVTAAEDGQVDGMFAAATCYRNGTGTAPDLIQSLRWLLAPLNAGNGDGIHEAHQVAESMRAEDIRKAGSLANQRLWAEGFVRHLVKFKESTNPVMGFVDSGTQESMLAIKYFKTFFDE